MTAGIRKASARPPWRVTSGEQDPSTVDRLLRLLPGWFGITLLNPQASLPIPQRLASSSSRWHATALPVDPRRSPALTGTCPGTSPLSASAAEVEQAMTESQPDFASFPAPAEGILVAMFITVRKVARSRDFYSRILGGTVILEENPCTVRLSNSWIIMNPGGPPTPDKPGITVADYQPGDTTSIFLNLRVADIHACYQEWKAKGAEFVTAPIDRGAEIRCYMRDPDGYLIEVGQSTGLLHGHLAAKRPEDLPG
jgi:catechol 2,3-dioxygenase-like lactoylglutathione lyase family enzyme